MSETSSTSSLLTPFQPALPSGYTRIAAADGQSYLVPEFLIDVTKTHLNKTPAEAATRTTEENNASTRVFQLPGGVHIAKTDALLPAVACISEQEVLSLHAEIEAVQQRYGITFKDAAQRLFMSEVACVQSHFNAMQGFASTSERIRNTMLNGITNPIVHIDKTPPHQLDMTPGKTVPIARGD
ncbi:hypothetical protein BDN70DRAFT_901365 [Pholiota conissans]|uniref:Uncharacterized protein n=1 Tax=Pholiota conissans TaxID=109636 RepID=A0A9P5YMS0_9AGAR|nr:hypothetical protein BDN70DRAFT_901365 [Pholiota conissans]